MKKITPARLLKALHDVQVEYLTEGNVVEASRLNVVTNTLASDPETLGKLANILQKVLK